MARYLLTRGDLSAPAPLAMIHMPTAIWEIPFEPAPLAPKPDTVQSVAQARMAACENLRKPWITEHARICATAGPTANTRQRRSAPDSCATRHAGFAAGMVGTARFELATYGTQNRRATRLRHAPNGRLLTRDRRFEKTRATTGGHFHSTFIRRRRAMWFHRRQKTGAPQMNRW